MKSLLHSFKRIFVELWYKRSDISLAAVRPNKLIYTLAYTFELILYSCWEFIETEATFFGISSSMALHVAHYAGSLLIMMLWSDRFRPLIHISVAMMLVGFAGFVLLPVSPLQLIFGILAVSGLGGAVTCARCGFAFAANNPERLIGITFMFFSVAGVYLLARFDFGAQIITTIFPLVLAVLLSICLLLFKGKDFEVKSEITKADKKGIYWALAFFIVYFALDAHILRSVNDTVFSDFLFFIIGMCLAGVILFVSFAWWKLNVWYIWNLFFFFAITMSVLAVFAPKMGTDVPHNLFAGLSLIGWPLAIYMLACAQRRFASYALLKRCTLIYAVLTPFTTLSCHMLGGVFPGAMPTVTLVYILVVVFALLVLSPYSYKHLFSVDWISDLHKNDMEKLKEKIEEVDRFKGYELTPRQREIAALLLLGKTQRQVAGELGVAESTVKMHIADLYKRLDIHSKHDLFRLFGVAEAEKESTHTSI